MDSLQDILGQKSFTPPDEVLAVKAYIRRKYQSESRIKLDHDAMIVYVPNAGLASTLQLERNKIIVECKLKNKLVIRLGR